MKTAYWVTIRRLLPLVLIALWVFGLLGAYLYDGLRLHDLGKTLIALFYLTLYVAWVADFGRRLVKLNFFHLPSREIRRTRLHSRS
jgi:hypothetical protein